MKRKSLLLLLLFALIAPWAANAQSVTLGSGTSTSSYLPVYNFYNYSISQQIYTAEEISASGNITSIAFYNGGAEKSRQFDIYMAHTSKSAFESTSDWIDVPESAIVYSDAEGSTTTMTADAWTTFTLDTPFNYNGTDNLVVVVIDRTGDYSYSPHMACRTYSTTEYQALYCYNDNYDALSPNGTNDGTAVSSTLGRLQFKNQIVLGGIQQAYPAPTDLTVSGLTATSATLNWTENGTATSWEVAYKAASDADFTTVTTSTKPYTIEGLTPQTAYTAKVRAYYSATIQSGWAETSFTTAELCPDGMVCIGTGTATNSYIPTYTYYNYSLTQQIYTAEEIGADGYIMSVDFHASAAKTRNLDIYMVSVGDKDSFDGNTDWIPVTADDKVFSGSVTFAAGDWTTIEFETPFEYDGRSNVALIVDDNTGSYESSPSFYAFSATNQAIRIYSDDTNYDPVNPSSYTGSVLTQKNRVRLAVGVPPTCPKPKNLAVSNVTNHTATLSWTAGDVETQWTVEYAQRDDFSDATSMTVSNNPTANLTGLDASTVYFARVKANCGGGDESEWADAISFETEVACPVPANLNITDITSNSAVISWEGDAYELRYGTVSGRNRSTLTYDFENGLGDWTTIDADGDGFTWVTLSDLPNYTTSYTNVDTWAHGGSDAVLSGSYINGMSTITTDPDNLLVSPMVALGGSITFYAKGLDSNYPEHFGVCVSTTNNTDVNAFTVLQEWDTETDTEYHEYTVDLSAYTGMGYIAFRDFNVHDMYIVIIDDVTIEEGATGEVTWIETVTGVTSPYNLTGLDPETPYIVQVRANCGEDGYSEWVQRGFVTKGVCDVPTALTTTNVEAFSATLGWTGVQDSYNVQYRPVFHRETLYFDNFNNGITSWWSEYTYGTLVYFTQGDNIAMVGYGTDEAQYLISGEIPAFEGGSTVEFSHRLYNYQSESTSTTFQMGYSTTTADVDAFTWGSAVTVTSTSFSVYSEVIPSGTKYIAIKSTGGTDFGLMVDNFGIYGPAPEISEWTVVENVTGNSYIAEELLAETDYEWQVQGICADGVTEWSAIATFTTEPSCLVPTELDYEIEEGIAVLSWTSDATLFDIEVNETVIEGVANPYNLELEPETIYEVRVRTNCGDGDYSDWTDYIAFVSDCRGAKDLPYTFGFDEAKLGEYYACWTAYSYNTENATTLAYDPDDNTNIAFRFSSYDYASDYRQVLISPELNTEAAVAVQFDYKTYNTSAETFQVGYATDDFTSLDDFTFGDAISVNNNTEWATYSETFPAGTKYVAVLYSSNYQYYMYVDNFKFEESLGVTQTLELTAGYNWVSLYIDSDPMELLEALQEGLGENGVSIEGPEGLNENLGEGTWWGDLDYVGLTSGTMYLVLVEDDCEVSLEGMPVDPATVEITINPGYNWIGFTGTEEVSVEAALADFDAEDGDAIEGTEGMTEYLGDGMWWGDFDMFVPGQGYMYNSASDEVKTLYFNLGGEKARSSVVVSGSLTKQPVKVQVMSAAAKAMSGGVQKQKDSVKK